MTPSARDRRDLRWANTLNDIADAYMEIGAVSRATECWRLADCVAAGISLDDVLRRIYSPLLTARVAEEVRLLDSVMHDRSRIARTARGDG